MKQLLIKISILFLAATVCLGCGNSFENEVSGLQGNNPFPIPTNTPGPDPDPEPDPDPVTNLRIANANFFGGDNVVIIDGTTVDDDLNAFQSTTYFELQPGPHRVVVQGNVPAQSLETLVDETVVLAEGTDSTLAYSFDPNTSGFVRTLVLTDDTTPNAGQLQARLVNMVYIFDENNATLLDDNDTTLLGPIREDNVGPYTNINLQVLQNADALVGRFTETGGSEIDSFRYSTLEGTANSLIEALANQIGVSGLNVTIIFAYYDTNVVFPSQVIQTEPPGLFILVDDRTDGSTTFLSTPDVDN